MKIWILLLLPFLIFAKPYEGYVNADLKKNFCHELEASIETEHLIGRFVTLDDLEEYVALFSDEELVKSYGDGIPYSREQTTELMYNYWTKKYQKDGNPYTGFSFFEKNSNAFVLQIGIGNRTSNVLYVGYIAKKEFWGKGYTTEAATAIIHYFVPLAISQGYLLNGAPIEVIALTTKDDNIASQHVALNLGMTCNETAIKYNALRLIFKIPVEELKGFRL